MLSHAEITEKVQLVAEYYPLKRVAYFGSYASGAQTPNSDLDVLVEFTMPAVSLIMLAALKNHLEDELRIPVDIIHYPLPDNSILDIRKVVHVYGE